MTLYKIQPLLESGFNFSVVFPEKQKSLQEHSGFNFGLQEIALLIKKQTGNFANKNDIALDIDKYLFEAYQKHIDATEPKEEKKEEPKKEFTIEEQIQTSKKLIRLYEMKLAKASGDEKVRIGKLVKLQNMKVERLSKKKEQGGNAITVTSSVQDPKPTGADEVALTDTDKDPEQMSKGGSLSIGDSVHINDKDSNLDGKAGLIMGVSGKDYLLKVLHGGKEIDITVPKKLTTPFPENID